MRRDRGKGATIQQTKKGREGEKAQRAEAHVSSVTGQNHNALEACVMSKNVECATWVHNTRRNDLNCKTAVQLCKTYVVCSEHFEDNQFMNIPKRNSLIPNAIPTVVANVRNPPKLIASTRKPPKERCHPGSHLLTLP
ncbi:hypothetical protein CAPTEDRAFT_210203 [Capitella teleta]|uniref:THAP-type domain-containing protein n=1 Tax=Capitella teleta TaxID=283909 RepID=R7TW67_CAPTE|nr:hypothetical protein CAPTEDRAFT_210203 [Capitella teleta]|eukprot:ELT97802.1 hypothetical protein CAPTEDRAFT_210203 [Capitella teleta]